MSVLAGMYGAAVAVRNTLYERGVLPARRLGAPVISVGNLSVGGSGKTPFVILLGELLRQRGLRIAVLSRGYGRSSRGVRVVDPQGTALEFGDEPLLIARKLGVPVVVGEDRYAAGRTAEREFAPQLFLLDDGFQHRALARDFDIVLVTPEDARDRLLPAGRLREPLAAVARADAVALISGAEPQAFPLRGQLVWRVRRGILPPPASARPLAFCGIARPQSFFLQLRKAGVEAAAEAAFRDHYRYTHESIAQLLAVQQRAGADGFVTTEKDAVNLGPLAELLQPLAIVPVRIALENAEAALDAMLAAIARKRGEGVAKGSPAPRGT